MKKNIDVYVRDYLGNRDKWLKRVNNDPSISHATSRVAVHLALRMNIESFDTWPSIDTISNSTGVSRKAVILAIASLCSLHLIEVKKTSNKVNRYRLLFDGLIV